jgi:MerR family mercuric resistance operon transcriptional regulator
MLQMDTTAGRLAIGTLSKRTGCQIETIRYYERAGLMPAPARSPGGYRLYGTEHLKRLTFIRRARALGFSIGQVRTLLGLTDHHRRPCAQARLIAAAHLEDVRAKIADLTVMEQVLRKTVARCAEGAGSHCPLIEALYRDGPADGGMALRRSETRPERTGWVASRPAAGAGQRRRQQPSGSR